MKRKTLLESFKETVEHYRVRKTVGVMRTGHVIFIPTELMKNQEKETTEFIKMAKLINEKEEWCCPVEVEAKVLGSYAGVEFVFSFGEDTSFGEIVFEIENRL